jgi:hypothetical protein
MLEAMLRSRSRGAGAEIANCGSGASSGSFLFTSDLKKCYKKITIAEEVFVNCYNFNPVTFKSKKALFHIKLSGAGASAGAGAGAKLG